jgi:hypothetical protein
MAAALASTDKTPANTGRCTAPRSLTAADVLLDRAFNLLASSDIWN